MPEQFTPDDETTTPRHTAVALKGAPGRDVSAPARIVAKGDGALAEQILELAFAAGVKVREDADLVEVLNAVDVDCDVPLHALAAVAEILTYVYRANGSVDATAGVSAGAPSGFSATASNAPAPDATRAPHSVPPGHAGPIADPTIREHEG